MDLVADLDAYVPRSDEEAVDLERVRTVARGDGPWSRASLCT